MSRSLLSLLRSAYGDDDDDDDEEDEEDDGERLDMAVVVDRIIFTEAESKSGMVHPPSWYSMSSSIRRSIICEDISVPQLPRGYQRVTTTDLVSCEARGQPVDYTLYDISYLRYFLIVYE